MYEVAVEALSGRDSVEQGLDTMQRCSHTCVELCPGLICGSGQVRPALLGAGEELLLSLVINNYCGCLGQPRRVRVETTSNGGDENQKSASRHLSIDLRPNRTDHLTRDTVTRDTMRSVDCTSWQRVTTRCLFLLSRRDRYFVSFSLETRTRIFLLNLMVRDEIENFVHLISGFEKRSRISVI